MCKYVVPPFGKGGRGGFFHLPKGETGQGEGMSDSYLPVRVRTQTGSPTLIPEEPKYYLLR